MGKIKNLEDKIGWIYESPDGGKTITRRRPGADLSTRETLTENQQTKFEKNAATDFINFINIQFSK